jgi:transposase
MTLKMNPVGSAPHQKLQKIEYLREMLVELKTTASAEQEHLLVYFLEMAYFEACDAIVKLEKSSVKIRNGNQSTGMSV